MPIDKRKILRLGNALLDGAEIIYPNNGDTRYLEKTIAIRLHRFDTVPMRTITLYTDASGDDEIGYLAPLLRIASWDRKKDMQLVQLDWPHVEVQFSILDFDSDKLQTAIKAFNAVIAKTPFPNQKLATRRDFAEPDEDELSPYQGMLVIRTDSGAWQGLERHFHVHIPAQIYEAVMTLEASLASLASISEQQAWQEYYDQSLTTLLNPNKWCWHGQIENIS